MAQLPSGGEMSLDGTVPQGPGPFYVRLVTGDGAQVPDGWYLKISFGHGVSGVLLDEQAGEIRIPFEGSAGVLMAASRLTIAAEHRGQVVAGEVVRDGR